MYKKVKLVKGVSMGLCYSTINTIINKTTRFSSDIALTIFYQ